MGVVQERGRQIAAELWAAGVPATADPANALGLLPCVLVTPPSMESRHYGGRVVTWRLLLLADSADPAQAWEELDGLLDAFSEHAPWERAEPATYVLPNGQDSTAAYAVTYTETIAEE